MREKDQKGKKQSIYEKERSRVREKKEELNRKGKNTLQLFWLSISSYNLSFLKPFLACNMMLDIF